MTTPGHIDVPLSALPFDHQKIKKPRLPHIEGLRGVLIMWVLVIHFGWTDIPHIDVVVAQREVPISFFIVL